VRYHGHRQQTNQRRSPAAGLSFFHTLNGAVACTLGWWYNCQGWFAGRNKAAKFRGLKGFVAKRRKSAYRSRPIGGLDQSHVPSLAKVNRDRGQRLFAERRRA